MTPPTELIEKLRDQSKHQIIWGGNYFQLPPTSCILVWDKEQSGDFADCELAWTNLKKAVRKFTYRWNGMLQEPGKPKEKRLHPTQKPQALIYWCLDFAPEAKTVLDPFMGSGTTLLCARNRGKTAVGIDKDERYCEIAATRLSQRVLSFET
jgi:DNA modification methylase